MQKIVVDTNIIVSSLIQRSCLAYFIITGNTNDFTFPAYKQTKIVSPKEYWENHIPV